MISVSRDGALIAASEQSGQQLARYDAATGASVGLLSETFARGARMLATMVIVLIRTQLREGAELPAYDQLNERMFALLQTMPGFVAAKSYRSDDGDEISLIRFASAEALRAWREHPDHRQAQRRGREEFYATYDVEVCDVVRAYDFGRAAPGVRTGSA